MKYTKIKYLIVLIIFFPLIFQSIYVTTIKNSLDVDNQEDPHISGQISGKEQWLNNSDFSSQASWEKSISGDEKDVNASIRGDVANFDVLGEQKTFSLIADPPTASNWTEVDNPDFPAHPDYDEITSEGCWVRHTYDDQTANQNPSVHWDKNISMPVDMADYIITSASIQARVNATVDENLDRSGDTWADWGDPMDTYVVGDYVRFYVLVSDLEKNRVYEIAYFQTEELGRGNPPGTDILTDTYMIIVPQEVMIFYLSSVLSTDHCNFTVTLGMKLLTEDNSASGIDTDTFNDLIINYLNLTFTYEKKINQLTTVSWNQDGDKLSNLSLENYKVLSTEANLNFKYKISQNWTKTTSSINSEIRIHLNGQFHPITIKLSQFNTTFDDLNLYLSPPADSVNLSIQVFIADEFNLDQHINISIDDVYLYISYIIIIPETNENGDSKEIIQESGLNWVILSILLAVSGVLGVISLRTYYLVPRKRKMERYLLQRTQKYKDIKNIQAIVISHKVGGNLMYYKNYAFVEGEDEVLFSGFIQAIMAISEEITRKSIEREGLIELKDEFGIEKINELDFRHFVCLIMEREEIRIVLILNERASKRLKNQTALFISNLYFQFAKEIKNWKGILHEFEELITPFVNSHYELYYKESFEMSQITFDQMKLPKERKFTKLETRIINNIISILKDKNKFEIDTLINLVSEENKDLVIDAIESLIELKIIIPFIPKIITPYNIRKEKTNSK